MEKDLQKKIVFLMILFLIFYSVPVSAKRIVIAFRNDDISAKSDIEFENKILQTFRKYEIKPLYAVIPALSGNELQPDMPIVNSLKSWHNNGWIDIAMHGYTHEYKFSTLPFKEQDKRIHSGKKVMENALGTTIDYFCPPWNAVDKNTLLSLKNNNIINFSGYLGELPIDGINYLNSNCNLFEGPLGSLKEKINLSRESDKDILLIALYHTSYDFNKHSLVQLDSLLKSIVTDEKVVISSFSDMLANNDYKELLQLVNSAGFRLKSLKNNRYINKFFLNIPLVSDSLEKKINAAEKYYDTGNYNEVIDIYKTTIFSLWAIVIISFIAVAFAVSLIILAKIRNRVLNA